MRGAPRPYFGLCLGMQVMCIEFARNVLGLAEANSTEFNPKTPHPVISLMPDQQGIEDMGGTMRLGLYPCLLQPDTLAAEAYAPEPWMSGIATGGSSTTPIVRREEAGMVFSGLSPEGRLVEIAELSSAAPVDAGNAVPSGVSFATQPAPSAVRGVSGGGLQVEQGRQVDRKPVLVRTAYSVSRQDSSKLRHHAIRNTQSRISDARG